MPKRPTPPESAEKDDGKKPRTSDAETSKKSASASAVKPSAAAAAPGLSIGGRMTVAAASRVAATTTTTPSSKSSTQIKTAATSSAKSSNTTSGGNWFLNSLRAMSSGTTTTTSVEAKKKTTESSKSKKKPTTDATTSSTKKEPKAEPKSNGNGSTTNSKTSTKVPVVPFPHLPLENESHYYWTITIVPTILFFLFLLNMSAIIYILSKQTWNNMNQLKYDIEVEYLTDELVSSQNEVTILRNRMNKLEEAAEGGERMLKDTKEVFDGLFGPTTMMVGDGGEDGELLSSEEREEWIEKMRLLNVDREEFVRVLMDELTTLSLVLSEGGSSLGVDDETIEHQL